MIILRRLILWFSPEIRYATLRYVTLRYVTLRYVTLLTHGVGVLTHDVGVGQTALKWFKSYMSDNKDKQLTDVCLIQEVVFIYLLERYLWVLLNGPIHGLFKTPGSRIT